MKYEEMHKNSHSFLYKLLKKDLIKLNEKV